VQVTVLIVTRSDDNASVEMVTQAIHQSSPSTLVVRLDSDRYPIDLQISSRCVAGQGRTMRVGGQSVSLDAVQSLWHRRFFAGGTLSPDVLGDTWEHCVNESRRTLYGTIAALGCFEVDPWIAVRKTDHKELQLRHAASYGLDVGKTLISNDADEVRAFFDECNGQMVTKMQSSFAIYRDGIENVVFTTQVRRKDLKDLQGLAYCPMIFQELVPKRIELRATVIGQRVFTAAVDSQQSKHTRIDWRVDGEGLLDAWVPYTLPPPVEKGLLKVVAAFGLNYAAADFIVTPDGRHVFLEINAGGEWFWLQRIHPIAEAMADLLLGKSKRTPTL
jgi:glutathione synthase/RimK-type ligase-like ATP-grasp enzyme